MYDHTIDCFSVLQLFDHIAGCIGKFISEQNLLEEKLPLGFTFSFPCKQEGLAKARLSKWTKGFRCEGVVGEDICILLREALTRLDVSCESRAESKCNKWVFFHWNCFFWRQKNPYFTKTLCLFYIILWKILNKLPVIMISSKSNCIDINYTHDSSDCGLIY